MDGTWHDGIIPNRETSANNSELLGFIQGARSGIELIAKINADNACFQDECVEQSSCIAMYKCGTEECADNYVQCDDYCYLSP